MIWAILIFLGVPLWICAAGITITILKNRGLRNRPGDIPARVKRSGKKRWERGHALWVSDVFAWRASPASWNESLVQVTNVTLRTPSEEEQHTLRRLGAGVLIATLSDETGTELEVATGPEHKAALVGPFVTAAIANTTADTPQGRAADLSTERS